jgi:hypothetical protein
LPAVSHDLESKHQTQQSTALRYRRVDFMGLHNPKRQ